MHGSMRLTLVAVLGAALSGCSIGEEETPYHIVRDSAGITLVSNSMAGGWSPEEAPTFVEELVIGTLDGEGAYQFSTIISVAVDPSGNIYALDFQRREVKVFDPEGRHLRTMGRSGSGPGELGLSAALLMRGDTVGVVDVGNRRVQWFGPDGVQSGNVPIPVGVLAVQTLATEPGFIAQHLNIPESTILGSLLPNGLLVRYSATGEVSDTVVTLPAIETIRVDGPTAFTLVVGGANPVWTVAHGKVLTAKSTEMRISVWDRSGELTRIFDLDVPLILISKEREEQLRRAADGLLGTLRNAPGITLGETEFHPYFPAIASIVEGPSGTIWVNRIVDEAGGVTEWIVFDGEGKFLGILPADTFTPLRAVGDLVYGVRTDDLGVNYLVRGRLEGL